MCTWKSRAGQNRGETKVSDRFTSKNLSSCSSKPEGGEEGKTGLADNQPDILFLTSCLQSPKWFKCCLPRRLLLPLMLLQQSQALPSVCATKLWDEQKNDDICMFSGTGMGLSAALGVTHQCCGPRDLTTCHKSYCFPLLFVAWETHEQGFIKEGVVHFYYCNLYCIYY